MKEVRVRFDVVRMLTTLVREQGAVDIHLPMDGGGVVVGDKVKINLEVEAVLQS